MKKYLIIGISIVVCLSIACFMKLNENILLENVCYIQYKVSGKKDIVEKEMPTSQVHGFIDLVNDLELEKINETEKVKGWLISLDCFNEKKEYMYNIYLIGDLFYIDQTAYRLNKDSLNQINQFIKNEL